MKNNNFYAIYIDLKATEVGEVTASIFWHSRNREYNERKSVMLNAGHPKQVRKRTGSKEGSYYQKWTEEKQWKRNKKIMFKAKASVLCHINNIQLFWERCRDGGEGRRVLLQSCIMPDLHRRKNSASKLIGITPLPSSRGWGQWCEREGKGERQEEDAVRISFLQRRTEATDW